MEKRSNPNKNSRVRNLLATATMSGAAAVGGVLAVPGAVAGASSAGHGHNKPVATAHNNGHNSRGNKGARSNGFSHILFNGIYAQNTANDDNYKEYLRYYPDGTAYEVGIQPGDPQDVNKWLGLQCYIGDGNLEVHRPGANFFIQGGPYLYDKKTGSFVFNISTSAHSTFKPLSVSKDGKHLTLNIVNTENGHNTTMQMTFKPDPIGEQTSCESPN